MERMSGLDAGFYFADAANNPLHIASVTVFEGPAPSYGDLVRLIAAKLSQVPRYRQRVRTVPLNLGRPVWVDDPHFQILYHVRHTAVPAPGSSEQLRNLAGRVLSQRLDLDKPLWEIWLVEGLEGDRWATITKVHHSVVDGVGGIDLMTALFDLRPDTAPLDRKAERPDTLRVVPEPEPARLSLLLSGVRGTLTEPLRHLAALPGAARHLGRVGELRSFASGVPRTVGRLIRPTASSLTGPVGPHRRWLWAHATLDEIRQIRKAYGGTVNDVILTAVTRGFRDLLEARGELTDSTLVRALVPVSVRGEDEFGKVNNRVSAVLVNLPCGQEPALRRLFLIRSQMDDIKRTHQANSGDAIARLAGFAPTLLALGSRAALRRTQPLVQTVVTNVPGPPFPLYVLGRRMVELYPYVPLGMGIRVAIAIFSYEGALTFGLTGDFDGMPDLEVLGRGIRAGFDELSKDATAASG
jgi:diacylglycerol O-acyltransferase / wax synthase